MEIDKEVEVFRCSDPDPRSKEISPSLGYKCQAINMLSCYAANFANCVKWCEIAGLKLTPRRIRKTKKAQYHGDPRVASVQ